MKDFEKIPEENHPFWIKRLTENQNLFEKLEKSITELQQRHQSSFLEALRFMGSQMLEIAPNFINAIVAFRRDLRLPGEEEWFHEYVQALVKQSQDQIDKHTRGDH